MGHDNSTYLTLVTDLANKRISSGESQDEALAAAADDVLDIAEDRFAGSVSWFTCSITKQARLRARHEAKARRGVLKRFWRPFHLYREVLAGAELINHQQVELAAKTIPEERVPLLGLEGLFGGRTLRYFLLNSLHARAVAVAGEILHCLSAGHTEAAAARARTLYEIAVTLWFLSTGGAGATNGIDLCERYYVSMATERARMGMPSSDVDQVMLEKARDRWGRSFDAPYGWARDALALAPRQRATFAHIERQVDAAVMRHLYLEFNNAVHSGSFNTVTRNDWRRNFPSPTRPECDIHVIRRTGWCALYLLEFATYAPTKAIAFESEEWDELLAFGPLKRMIRAAIESFIAVPDPWEQQDQARSGSDLVGQPHFG